MAREIFIDRDECTSCVQCADNLSDVFAMDDDDIAVVVGDGSAGSEEDIQEEIDTCPGECIHWKDEM